MNLQDLRNALPEYAKDLKLNLDSVLSDAGAAGLSPKQIRVIAVACATINIVGGFIITDRMLKMFGGSKAPHGTKEKP